MTLPLKILFGNVAIIEEVVAPGIASETALAVVAAVAAAETPDPSPPSKCSYHIT
jgi:hypothetical protein